MHFQVTIDVTGGASIRENTMGQTALNVRSQLWILLWFARAQQTVYEHMCTI